MARGAWSVSRGAWSGEIGKLQFYRTLWRAREREAVEREGERVCVCEGGSGLLGVVEVVRSES